VTNPGLDDGTYLAMAAVATVLFFASILLHELGHAIQAGRDGIPIEGITLWVFGGIASLGGQPPSAGAEFRMAIAGPAVSLALGVACLAAALGLPLPDAVDGVLFWLGQINVYLLVFNQSPPCRSTAAACCRPSSGPGGATTRRQRGRPARSAARSGRS